MYNPYQGGFPPQQTGYGYQQQPQQPQQPNNGFYPPQPAQQPQQTGFYQMPQQQLYPLQTFQPQQTAMPPQGLAQQPTGYLVTQPTGFQGAPSVVENVDLKIPAIRLSFITADDQKKFEHLFRTAVPKGETALSGDAASNILLRLGLPPVTLADIWLLLDFNKLGLLLFPEFALALHFCSMAKRGDLIPRLVPQKWLNEVQSFIDAIALSVPDDPAIKLANTPFAQFAPPKPDNDWMNPPQIGAQTGALTGAQTGYGMSAQRTGGGSLVPLQPQQTLGLVPAQRTGGLIPVQKTGPLQAQGTGYNRMPAQGTGYPGQQPQGTGFNQPLQSQGTGYQPLQSQGTGYQPLQLQGTGYQPLQAQGTGYGL